MVEGTKRQVDEKLLCLYYGYQTISLFIGNSFLNGMTAPVHPYATGAVVNTALFLLGLLQTNRPFNS